MKRLVLLPFLGLAATATVLAAPGAIPAARAQSTPQPKRIQLTSAQKTQVQGLREDLRRTLADILTDDQRTQFQTAFRTSGHVPTAMATVENLTPRQKVGIRSALKEFQRELGTVLSKEQLAELQSNREQLRWTFR